MISQKSQHSHIGFVVRVTLEEISYTDVLKRRNSTVFNRKFFFPRKLVETTIKYIELG
jgi:hypothetical protein